MSTHPQCAENARVEWTGPEGLIFRGPLQTFCDEHAASADRVTAVRAAVSFMAQPLEGGVIRRVDGTDDDGPDYHWTDPTDPVIHPGMKRLVACLASTMQAVTEMHVAGVPAAAEWMEAEGIFGRAYQSLVEALDRLTAGDGAAMLEAVAWGDRDNYVDDILAALASHQALSAAEAVG